MVTNFDNHWDNIPNNETSYTIGMIKWDIARNQPIDNTETLFIKRHRISKQIEKCWIGKVSNFKKTNDIHSKVFFNVEIEQQVFCPEKYKRYPEGWYCIEEIEGLDKNVVKIGKSTKIELKDVWNDIQNDFEETKHKFGKKINFVKSQFKREIIFRDVEQAYILEKNGFNKPAVILAGGVIEELLRIFLETKGENIDKKKFEDIIEICEKKGYLKKEISNLVDAIRLFRNSVHLAKEKSKKYTISKATARATIALIFTIVNDFQRE
jgi:hypothetical protein